MTIEKTSTTYVFIKDNGATVVPLDAVLFVTNDDSDSINVRLKASRKNVLKFDYKSVTNYTGTSASDFVNNLIS